MVEKKKVRDLSQVKKRVNSYFNSQFITTADENGDHFYAGVERAEELVLMLVNPKGKYSKNLLGISRKNPMPIIGKVQFISSDKINILVYQRNLESLNFSIEKHKAALEDDIDNLTVSLTINDKETPFHNQKFYFRRAFPKK